MRKPERATDEECSRVMECIEHLYQAQCRLGPDELGSAVVKCVERRTGEKFLVVGLYRQAPDGTVAWMPMFAFINTTLEEMDNWKIGDRCQKATGGPVTVDQFMFINDGVDEGKLS